jgi:hypothetical protein
VEAHFVSINKRLSFSQEEDDRFVNALKSEHQGEYRQCPRRENFIGLDTS